MELLNASKRAFVFDELFPVYYLNFFSLVYKPSVLQDKCGSVVDKYVEYDLVIVSLDALLLKRQAFRHILINSGIQSHWKFCLVLLISEAIIKLLNQPVTEDTKQWKSDSVIYSALEFDLYWNFLTSAIELFCFLFVVLMCVLVWKNITGEHKDQWPSMQECACGLMLSSLGKVLVLPAVLWGLNYSVLYTWLCTLFTIAANIQAVRVLCPMWNVLAVTVCILLGHFSTYGARDLLLRAKSAIT
ncbi:protein ARV1-like [Mercenaria mercenaria]|uniref:protein ARV1-like n=1 Tax=Mercenaria mercenaria TaxID=6596 RepID=UPI00234F5B7E|nr:protein ARV1-like [Mercenaria mercenaria]